MTDRRMHAPAAAIAGAAVATVLLAGCGPGLQSFSVGRSVSGPTYSVTAVFTDASGLPIGGHVELHNVTVGRVTSMTTRNFQAYAHLVISRSVRLPVGTTARLALTTPLGEEYVALRTPPGSAVGAAASPTSLIGDGGVIPVSQTHRSADVEDLLSGFSQVLNGGGISQIHDIIHSLDKALTGHTKSGRAVIAQLNDVLGQLDAHTTEIDAALSSLSSLSSQLAAQKDLIARGLTDLTPGIEALHADTAGFTKLLVHLSRAGSTAASVLGTVQAALVSDLKGLGPALDTLVSVRHRLTPTLAGLLRFGRLLDRAVPGDYIDLSGALQETQ